MENTQDKIPEEENTTYQTKGNSAYRWIIVALAVMLGIQLIFSWGQQGHSISYTTFKHKVKAGKVAKVEIDQNSIQVYVKKDSTQDAEGGPDYTVIIPSTLPDNDLIKLLESQDVKIVGVKDTSGVWSMLIWFVLPIVVMIGFFIFLNMRMRGQGGGPGGLLSMGKMNAEAYTRERVKTTFEDVAGCKEQKEALFEIIHFMKRPEDFKKLGGSVPKGVLLVGPPGTGKTLLARAVAGEAGVPFYHVAGSAFLEMLVGVGASRVRDLFRTAKRNAPCIIFVDELDSIGRRRGGIQGYYGGGASEMEQTLNQMLSEMDGFEPNENVIVLAATNQPEVLDPALLRPGRFDRRVVIDQPNQQEREELLQVHVRNVPLGPDVHIRELARTTPGNSGADLKNLVNEAAILASKKRKDKVEKSDFLEALDTIVLGHVRSSLILSEEEKKRTAYHEAGHALIAKLLPSSDPVTKVTIVPRGRALGVTMQTPLDERHNYTKDYLQDRLVILLGGRAAEQMTFDSISTGAENDLMQCTTLARNMVARYGMSEAVGNLSLLDPGADSYLGENPFSARRNFSEETLQLVDTETRRLIDKAYERAVAMLTAQRETLVRISETLLSRELIDGHELDRLIAGEVIPPLANGE